THRLAIGWDLRDVEGIPAPIPEDPTRIKRLIGSPAPPPFRLNFRLLLPPLRPASPTRRDISVRCRPWPRAWDPSLRPFWACRDFAAGARSGAPARPGCSSRLRTPA